MQFNAWNDYAESLRLLSFVVFLFQFIKNCKSALPEKMDNISRADVFYLRLKGSPQEVQVDM